MNSDMDQQNTTRDPVRLIAELGVVSEPEAKSDILRLIKNHLIGHRSRKAQFIQAGLLTALRRLLVTLEVTVSHVEGLNRLLDGRLATEVANIVCLISHEGPEFVQAILNSEIPRRLRKLLLSDISSNEGLAILKCFNAIADNLPTWGPGSWMQDTRVTDELYTRGNVKLFGIGMCRTENKQASQQVCELTIALICKTCRYEWQKQALVDIGVLDTLAERLAFFVVHEGHVVPQHRLHDDSTAQLLRLANLLPASAHLSPVLEVVVLLVEDSKARADMFLSNPALATVLPYVQIDRTFDVRHATWQGSYTGAAPSSQIHTRITFDDLIPVLPLPDKSSSSSSSNLNFPPLGSSTSAPNRRSYTHTVVAHPPSAIPSDSQNLVTESLLIPWLLIIARDSHNRRRLLAIKLLVTLYSLELTQRPRSHTFGALLVPLLVQALEPSNQCLPEQQSSPQSYLCNGMYYSRAAPAVLAALIIDDPDLQSMAVEAKAIVKLAIGLRKTFEEPSVRRSTPWQPYKYTSSDSTVGDPGETLGHSGPTASMRLDMAYREGTLKALAAIAPFNDEYRKQICDQGCLTQIMLALEPFHSVSGNSIASIGSLGNSASTILAACGAVRALTRSVTALRTKLVDAEVAKSIINLMNNPDPEVRIAATKVLANLAMYLSPMKESVGETAVVKKLCEQAHSANARLRLESIWALKQLVVNASKKLKQEIINELGSSWIKLLIKTDPYDIPEGEVIGLVDRDYPPRSRPIDDSNEPDDVIMGDGLVDDSNRNALSVFDSGAANLMNEETSFSRRSPEDDLAIQEQVLDLIRNLFCGDNASDIVDYLVGEIGKEDFFRILLTRLRPRTIMGATRKDNEISSAPAGIVVKVLYVMVHVAACSHKWRSTIAREHALLKQILTFATHTDRSIRAQCCWIAINLMYEDEVSDHLSCKQRAIELQKLGFFPHLRKLESDSDLDVRERAKTAIYLMTSLLG